MVQPDILEIGTSAVMGLVLLACIYLWISKLLTREPLLDYEPRSAVPWGAMDLAFVVSAWIIAQYKTLQILDVRFDVSLGKLQASDFGGITEQQAFAYFGVQAAVNSALIVGFLLIVLVANRARLRSLGFELAAIGEDIRIGIGGFLMLAPPVLVLQAILVSVFNIKYEHVILEAIKANYTPMVFGACALLAVVVAPILEELLFRVLLQGWLETVLRDLPTPREFIFGASAREYDESSVYGRAEPRRTPLPPRKPRQDKEPANAPATGKTAISKKESPLSAEHEDAPAAEYTPNLRRRKGKSDFSPVPILISSGLFAAAHPGASIISLFFLAIGLGYLYQRTHRILPCILVHMLLNGTTMLLLWLELQGGLKM